MPDPLLLRIIPPKPRLMAIGAGALLAVALLGRGLTAAAARVAMIEQWTTDPIGRRGVPPGWTAESFGRRADYDLTIEEHVGLRALHLRSRDEHSTIVKDITGQVRLEETPILEWTWRAITLPTGGDLRRRETTDLAAQIYVVWPRTPAWLRSRIIGYVWDASAPAGTIVRSRKTGTVTFVVVRSGPGDLGMWLTERRNVRDDYMRIFGEAPEDPRGISLSIDSNDTRSTAESFIGPLAFKAP